MDITWSAVYLHTPQSQSGVRAKIQSSFSRNITPKHETNNEADLRDIAPGQHSFENTSQRWRAVDDMTARESNPRSSALITKCLTTELTGWLRETAKIPLKRLKNWTIKPVGTLVKDIALGAEVLGSIRGPVKLESVTNSCDVPHHSLHASA